VRNSYVRQVTSFMKCSLNSCLLFCCCCCRNFYGVFCKDCNMLYTGLFAWGAFGPCYSVQNLHLLHITFKLSSITHCCCCCCCVSTVMLSVTGRSSAYLLTHAVEPPWGGPPTPLAILSLILGTSVVTPRLLKLLY